MVDPLSIASTILALISVGATIYNSVNDVNEAIKNVKLEISSLEVVLNQLNRLISTGDSPISLFPQGLQDALLENLKNLMAVQWQLAGALKSYMNLGPEHWLPAMMRQVKWVLVKERDVDKLRQHLDSHKGTLTVTMMMLQTVALGRVLKGQGEVHEVVRGIRSDLGYNSKATNDTLNEIRESLRCLQAKLKEEVSKNDAPGTWDTMFGYNQTQHYLDGLGEFIGSGGYEAALRIHERRQSAPLSGTIYNQPAALPNWQDAVANFAAPPPGVVIELLRPARRWTTPLTKVECDATGWNYNTWGRENHSSAGMSAVWPQDPVYNINHPVESPGITRVDSNLAPWSPPLTTPQHDIAHMYPPTWIPPTWTPPTTNATFAQGSFGPNPYQGYVTATPVMPSAAGGEYNYWGTHPPYSPRNEAHDWTHYPVQGPVHNGFSQAYVPRTAMEASTPSQWTTYFPQRPENPPKLETNSDSYIPDYSPPPQVWEPDPEPEEKQWTNSAVPPGVWGSPEPLHGVSRPYW